MFSRSSIGLIKNGLKSEIKTKFKFISNSLIYDIIFDRLRTTAIIVARTKIIKNLDIKNFNFISITIRVRPMACTDRSVRKYLDKYKKQIRIKIFSIVSTICLTLKNILCYSMGQKCIFKFCYLHDTHNKSDFWFVIFIVNEK